MSTGDKSRPSTEERELQTIFSLATPREAPPELIERKVRAAVHAEWRKATAGRPKRWLQVAALAASVVLAVAAGFLLRPGVSPEIAFEQARLLRVQGQSVSLQGTATRALGPGEVFSLATGDRLQTGNSSGLSLDLGAGGELRLGANSELEIMSGQRVYLTTGQLFLATREGGDAELVIESALGQVRHMGTRFRVLVTRERLRVDVRDGVVLVDSGKAMPARAETGMSAYLEPDGQVRLMERAPFGPDWSWVDQLAPPFAIDGRSLHAAASWAAEQSGRRLAFADSGIEREARATTLHGDLELTDPLPGLRQIMLTTRLQFELQDDRIYISVRR